MDYSATHESLLRQAARDLNLNHPFVRDAVWPVRNCWHFSSDGNYAEALFYDDSDFKDALNRIGTLCLRFPVLVLAFCLMDNHFHFVLYGGFEPCNRFAHEFIRLTGWSLSLRYGRTDPVKDIPIDYTAVNDDLYLCRAICYDILNPTSAGLDWMFYDYPWSSGPLYFRHTGYWSAPGWLPAQKSMISEINVKDRQKILKSKENYPDSWWLTEGMLFPGLFVEADLVKSFFRTSKGFNYYVSRHRKDDIDSEKAIISRIGIPDGELRIHRDEILMRDWGGVTIRKLNIAGRLKVAAELRRQYGVSAKAVARITRLPLEDVERML